MFLEYWAKNRERQKKWLYQLAVGLPVGGILAGFILINFYSGWYTRATMVANSRFNPVVLYIAAAAITVFIAIFSKKFQWDQQEQRYRELLAKKQKETENTTENHNQLTNNQVHAANNDAVPSTESK
mgnify:CR=1 FL=1